MTATLSLLFKHKTHIFCSFCHAIFVIDLIIFQGQAFTIKERQLLGIHGLLPPSVLTQDQQVFVCMENFYRFKEPLDKYIYLMGLQDRNEKLFYRVVIEHIDVMMPIIYTPTVGLACQKYGLAFRRPRYIHVAPQTQKLIPWEGAGARISSDAFTEA